MTSPVLLSKENKSTTRRYFASKRRLAKIDSFSQVPVKVFVIDKYFVMTLYKAKWIGIKEKSNDQR